MTTANKRIDRGDHAWEQIADTDATDGRAMQVLPADRTSLDTGFAGTAPELQFEVDFTHAGAHYVWMLGQNDHHRHAHSVHVGLDGQEVASASGIGPLPYEYAWHNALGDGSRATIEVDATGEATLNVWMHHAGVIVDRLVLATDVDHEPVGDGVIVQFADTALESAVRNELGLEADKLIRPDHMESLTELSAPGSEIHDLGGLEYAVNLQTLDLGDNAIADIGALTDMATMEDLRLNTNRITDITPLMGICSRFVLTRTTWI